MTPMKHMKDFEVQVDLTLVYHLISGYKFNLKEYSNSEPVIKITAKTPDHACHLIRTNLINLLGKCFAADDKLIKTVCDGMRIKRLKQLG